MKQKQVKTTPKNANQNVVKAVRAKKVKEAAVEESDEEVVEEVVVAKKPAKKTISKAPKKVVEKVIEEREEDDEIEDDEEDGDDQDIDEVEERQEEEEEDEEEEEQEEDDEEEEQEDDEKEPIEKPTIPTKVKSGEIPPNVPLNKIVHLKNLPKKCKQIDIVQAFVTYGAIDQIHIFTKSSGTVANVAFKTAKAAKSALADNKKIKVNDCLIEVTPKYDSVFINNLKSNTTEDQIREHFAACGEIVSCRLFHRKFSTICFIFFPDKKATTAAKKLHNSVLNDTTIGVYESTNEANLKLGKRDYKLTIMLKNKQQLENIERSKLEEIFAKCGEIVNIEVLCNKIRLAFITFKNEEAVKKAFKLNGKTEGGLDLEIEEFNPEKKKTSIYVYNLTRNCTEEDLSNHFSRAGEISRITLKHGFAIINFKDSDAYCKSFLLNESYIKNQIILIQPYSKFKRIAAEFNGFNNNKGHKRPAQNGNSVFKGKKPKIPKME